MQVYFLSRIHIADLYDHGTWLSANGAYKIGHQRFRTGFEITKWPRFKFYAMPANLFVMLGYFLRLEFLYKDYRQLVERQMEQMLTSTAGPCRWLSRHESGHHNGHHVALHHL